MARSEAIVVDWNAFRVHRFNDPEVEFWQRFPIEIDGSNIVTPHLFAIPRRPGGMSDGCTIADPPIYAVFAYRTAAHHAYLMHDVAPRLGRTCANVVLVDSARRLFDVVGREHARPLAELGERLDRWTNTNAHADVRFDKDVDHYEERLGASTPSRRQRLAPRIEQAPLRLWEALFMRGHAYRCDLIDGEVTLVGDLGSTLAANRSLMQCVRDAEQLCGTSAVEQEQWIRVAGFRFCQRGEWLEIRVALTAADIRVAFAPYARASGADKLPGLVGVLLAGGDNGKTELMDGYTWSSVWCRDRDELAALEDRLAAEITSWTGAAVDRDGSEYPSHTDGRWALRARPERSRPTLGVYVPMYRDDVLPWEVVT